MKDEPTRVPKERVTRHLVHRRAISEVYLTESEQVGDASFSIEAQWPRRHYFFDAGAGHPDLVLVSETLRQATILTAHRYFGIPQDHVFLMGRLEAHLTAGARLPTSAPADIDLVVDVDRVRRGSRGVTALRTRLAFSSEGVPIAEGLGELQILEKGIYARIRPSAVSSSDGVVHEAARQRGVELTRHDSSNPRWELNLDQSHPVFFDHPLDHVPGMAIIEAVQQLLQEVNGSPSSRIVSFDGRFLAFLDLDAPIFLAEARIADPTASPTVEVTLNVEQHGRVAAVLTASGSL